MSIRDDRSLGDRFRVAFITSAKSLGVDPFALPIRDFLAEDCFSSITCPYTLAATAIVYFCVDDGKYNNSQVAILTAFTFLTGIRKCDLPKKIIAQDLIEILNTTPTVEAIISWAKTAFP